MFLIKMSIYFRILCSFFISAEFIQSDQLPTNINKHQHIFFTKSLNGEIFKTDLHPSLTLNISYVQAESLKKVQVKYSLNSTYFSVNEINGQIFLINYLPTDSFDIIRYLNLTITAYSSFGSVSSNDVVSIVNVNNRPPEFVSSQRVFEIEEDNLSPSDLVYKNGSLVEIQLFDPDPVNKEISLKCENTKNYPTACNTFTFNQISSKSTNTNWYGTIRVLKKLNYLEQSIYQFYGIAYNDAFKYKKVLFKIKVLPNLNKAPVLSKYCYFFTTYENNPPNTVIGELNIAEEYDLALKAATSFSVITNIRELLNSGLSIQNFSDVNFELARKHINIKSRNQLLNSNPIDRDSNEFSNIDGILNVLIKVYYTNSPFIFNYYRIKIIVMDLNDNVPTFAFVSKMKTQNVEELTANVKSNHILTSTFKENEIGLISFDNFNSTWPKSLIVYDLDLHENSTFSIYLSELKSNEFSKLSMQEINNYFKLEGYANSIQKRSSVDLINYKPIDFEKLPMSSYFDSNREIGRKIVSFSISARETLTSELYSSISIPIVLTIEDVNDNSPEFSQDAYFGSISQIFSNSTFQKIIQFRATDQDSGHYGIAGFRFYLLGDQNENFFVDADQQVIFLRPCFPNCNRKKPVKPFYYLTLICKDNNGVNGNTGFATVIITFLEKPSSCLGFNDRNYYLLATGSSGIDIPSLTIKPFNSGVNDVFQYNIQDTSMKQYFSIDHNGAFRIIAKELNEALSPSFDGKFTIPISITSSKGCSIVNKIYVQLSKLITQSQCPKISVTSLCEFNINQTVFDTNRIRLCFYGKNPPAFNLKSKTSSFNTFYEQIYYSLLPNSPNHLFLNPFDGCVKLAPTLDLKENYEKYIQYSVGAFNINYPDCISSNERSCLISINNPKRKPIKCSNSVSLISNSSSYKLTVTSYEPDTVLMYSIIREERFRFDGSFENTEINHLFHIDKDSGLIQLKSNQMIDKYSSVLVIVKVKDITNDLVMQTESLQCYAEFRFTRKAMPRSPQFVGPYQRFENICEDLPVGGVVTSLNAIDLSLTNQSLCYSILNNEYFGLKCNQDDPSPSGLIILKKSINTLSSNFRSFLNLTASLYYCYQSTVLAQQKIIFNVLNVNKYPPRLNIQVSTAYISLSSNSNYSTSSISILDEDSYPYNYFNCFVENENNFFVINDNDRKTIKITYKKLNSQQENIRPYTDVSVKCCDDLTYWGDSNQCFSVGKCSSKSIRIIYTDLSTPVYCINNQQVNFITDNTPALTKVGYVSCISNYTSRSITYSLNENSNYFTVNQITGEIILTQAVSSLTYETLNLDVVCSNGLRTDSCSTKFTIFPAPVPRPVWIYPNVYNFEECITIKQNLDLNSLLTTVRAELSYADWNTNGIQYSFVDQGCLTDRVNEFQIKSSDVGKIYLSKKLNRSVNIYRELTLAASYSYSFSETPIIANQYMCIRILTLNDNPPCFPLTPDASKWPYQVDLSQSTNECFYDNIVHVSNNDYLNKIVYYYIIPSNLTSDDLYSYFTIEQNTGIICPAFSSDILSNFIVNSTLSYVDQFSLKTCYNLIIFASTKILTIQDLQTVAFENTNCSFSYLKVCTNKIKVNFRPPEFRKTNTECEKIKSLDNLSKFDVSCLYQFQFMYSLTNAYNFSIQPINNFVDTKLFYVNKSTNCLSLNINNESNLLNGSIPGVHLMKINVSDSLGGSDSMMCKIYLIESCHQRIFLTTAKDSQTVRDNLDSYKNFIYNQISDFVSAQVEVIVDGIFSFPKNFNNHADDSSNTILEFSFYDNVKARFLENNDLIPNFKSLFFSKEAKELKIINITSSCSFSIPEPAAAKYSLIVLWPFFLTFLIFLMPFLFCYILCFSFKKLKYQNNRIIMKQKVIPIIKDCSTSQLDDESSQYKKHSSHYRKSSRSRRQNHDFSSDSSPNYAGNKISKVKRGGSFNSGFYDDAIIEEQEQNDEVIYRRSVQASELLKNSNQINRPGPIVIREQLTGLDDITALPRNKELEYDTINSRSLNAYKF